MLLSRVMVFGVVASASSTSPASDTQMKGVSIFLSGQTENAQNLFLKKLVVDGQVASAAGGRGIARTGSSPPESEQPKATSSSLPSTGPNLLFDIEGRSAVQRRLLADNTMRLPVMLDSLFSHRLVWLSPFFDQKPLSRRCAVARRRRC